MVLPTLALLLAAAPPALAVTSLTTSATSNADKLALDGTGSSSEHIVKVADLAITTDSPNGYTLSVSSGNLSNADGQTPIALQVTTVTDGAPAPGSAEFTTPSGSNYSVSTASAGQADQDLYIKYTPAALQDPGLYSASIALLVSDN